MSRKKQKIYDHDSLFWLAKNYIWQKGLRSWTWEVIINGIIQEHAKSLIIDQQQADDFQLHHIELIWHTFLKVAKIQDLKKVSVTSNPNHPHVKAILFMYSMESFLYKRVNKISRDKDSSSISTLGPFAVALTRIID